MLLLLVLLMFSVLLPLLPKVSLLVFLLLSPVWLLIFPLELCGVLIFTSLPSRLISPDRRSDALRVRMWMVSLGLGGATGLPKRVAPLVVGEPRLDTPSLVVAVPGLDAPE